MKRFVTAGIALGLAAIEFASPADAAALLFTGTMSGLGVTGADASCAPFPFRGTIAASTSVGHSSLGDFSYSHNICLGGVNAGSAGSFLLDFGLGTINGSLTGFAAASSTPGISNVTFNYTILGGTGQYLGASGMFAGVGTTDARMRPSLVSQMFQGTINAPAVPEPATWAMMICGFAGIGFAMRRSRRRRFAQTAFG